jgi:DNA polymerase III sliding clamp (beta) subunit (PCNA family)
MATRATFSAATLADAVQKASKIAPTKGAAFDQAAGLLFDVRPEAAEVFVSATNMDSSYKQRVPMTEGEGGRTLWRLPSTLLTRMMSSLTMDSGETVDLIDTGADTFLRVKSGRFVAKLAMFDTTTFPRLEEFTSAGMASASDFASRVEQVAWACDPSSNTLNGVHIDGERIVGCNQSVLAVVPCVVPIEHPVTVPLYTMAPLLRTATDFKLRAHDKKLLMMLDGETWATSQLVEAVYPQYQNVMRKDFSGNVKANRGAFVEAVNRILVLAATEKLPRIELKFDGTQMIKTLTFDMDVPEVGRMQDMIDVASDEWDDVFTIYFSAQQLVKAVETSRRDFVNIEFGSPTRNGPLLPIRVSDDSGYEVYVMPRKV